MNGGCYFVEGWAGNWGVDTALWPDPPLKKKGSIDAPPPPKVLPRLTPGRRRSPGPKIRAKNENGIFGISASRGFRKVIICHIFGEKRIADFQCS